MVESNDVFGLGGIDGTRGAVMLDKLLPKNVSIVALVLLRLTVISTQ